MIANRNYGKYRYCFELYSICFYEHSVLTPDCIDDGNRRNIPLLWHPNLNDEDVIVPDDIGVLANPLFNNANTWIRRNDMNKPDICWYPYSQYLIFNFTEGFYFSSIGYVFVCIG